ncbi:MAG: class I mannose-6-phosphate isomerase [Ruminococcus sp.]|nr:class I mannose-6-phosphate isomerase [Ruminococcus sp.]
MADSRIFQPFRLRPAIKDYIWGGTRLRDEYGKKSSLERLAESWELSCHPDGMSVIDSGICEGMTLGEYIERYPAQAGSVCRDMPFFPVLVKLIDARNDLSVQVHPDDEYALEHENSYGKTEMWYVIDCEPGAELVYGFKERLTREQFREAIDNGTLMELVNRVPVKKGDTFFIPSGTLHAIGRGMLIAEIQQNSNITYRVYDYGRLGADGKPRELHTEKAIEVTCLAPPPEQPEQSIHESETGAAVRELAQCRYFRVTEHDINGSTQISTGDTSFGHILVIEGSAVLSGHDFSLDIKKGDSIFLPAGCGMSSISGRCRIIHTAVPEDTKQL